MTDIRRTTCPYDCPASCGLLATIENGRVAGVAGDPEHPASKGLICKKMQQYQLSVNSPDRILFPMRRTGNKGDRRTFSADHKGKWPVGDPSVLLFRHYGRDPAKVRGCLF